MNARLTRLFTFYWKETFWFWKILSNWAQVFFEKNEFGFCTFLWSRQHVATSNLNLARAVRDTKSLFSLCKARKVLFEAVSTFLFFHKFSSGGDVTAISTQQSHRTVSSVIVLSVFPSPVVSCHLPILNDCMTSLIHLVSIGNNEDGQFNRVKRRCDDWEWQGTTVAKRSMVTGTSHTYSPNDGKSPTFVQLLVRPIHRVLLGNDF